MKAALIDRLRLLGEVDSTQTAHFHEVAAAQSGLGVTDMKALSILLREGPQTAGDLTRALHVTSGAVTGVIDRLTRRRLARRTWDPLDQRRAIVTANRERIESGKNVYQGIGDAFAALYAGYTTEQLEFLVRHLEASIRITSEQTARLTAKRGSRAPPAARPRSKR